MKIILDENIYIRDNKYGFDLVSKNGSIRTNKATGEKSYEQIVLGYFPTLSKAIQRYILISTNNSIQETTLKEYIKIFERNIERIDNILPNWNK